MTATRALPPARPVTGTRCRGRPAAGSSGRSTWTSSAGRGSIWRWSTRRTGRSRTRASGWTTSRSSSEARRSRRTSRAATSEGGSATRSTIRIKPGNLERRADHADVPGGSRDRHEGPDVCDRAGVCATAYNPTASATRCSPGSRSASSPGRPACPSSEEVLEYFEMKPPRGTPNSRLRTTDYNRRAAIRRPVVVPVEGSGPHAILVSPPGALRRIDCPDCSSHRLNRVDALVLGSRRTASEADS